MTKLVFLPVPDSFRLRSAASGVRSGQAFPINPKIPIPVEIPADCGTAAGSADGNVNGISGIANLTIDMIISGMLRAIEEKKVKQEWIDYYSGFILFLRPDILEICQTHEENSRKNAKI